MRCRGRTRGDVLPSSGCAVPGLPTPLQFSEMGPATAAGATEVTALLMTAQRWATQKKRRKEEPEAFRQRRPRGKSGEWGDEGMYGMARGAPRNVGAVSSPS